MALGETAKLIVQLNLDDRLSSKMGRVNSSLSNLNRGLGQIGRGTGQVAAGIGRIGAIAGTVAVGGFVAVAKAAGDFEAQLNTINTIVKLSDADLKRLGEGIRQTFRETGQPLEDLTAAYYDLLSAGIKVEDAQSILNTSVKLGIGGLATTEEAVNLLTTAVNAYGLNATGAAGAADIFAAAVRDGKVTVAEISASFADVAPLAAQYGISLEEIGAAYATLTARGVPATEVGTQFNRAIIEGLKPGTDLVKVLDGLGGSFEDLIRKRGLVQTLQDIREEAEKQGIPFQDLFGRIEAYKFALATTGPNQARFNQELALMGEAAGEVNAQFAERQQGLNFQIAKLKALAQDAGITIGQALLPKLVPLVTKLNDFIQKNQGKIAQFGQQLADGFASFADKVQKADFSGFINTLKILGEVGKKVADIFLSLPAGVQAALVTGVALNKLSGGLLGTGAGNILGGAIKIAFDRFAARGSSAFNPLYVAVTNQIPGAGGGPGTFVGGGGKGGNPFSRGVLGVASKIFAGLFVADLVVELTTGTNLFDALLAPLPTPRRNAGPVDWKNPNRPVPVSIEKVSTSAKLREGGPLGATLPNTALPMGPGGAVLPDTALAPLKGPLDTIANNTSKLPPIVSNQERAAKLVAQRVNESRAAVGRGFTELGGITRSVASTTTMELRNTTSASRATAQRVAEQRAATDRGFANQAGYLNTISRKNFSPTVNVSARISNVVTVNANRVLERITEARVRTGTIPEFA